MDIVGLEVIRARPAMETKAASGEKVELTYSATLRVHVGFNYRGPAGKATLYGAIGIRHPFPEYIPSTFDEVLAGQEEINLPDSAVFTPLSGKVDIGVTAAIKPGTDYDLYCKLLEYPGAGMPEVDNIINIVGIPPTFRLIQHTIYSSYYIYDGEVEVSTFSATISPFTPSGWAAERFAQEVKKGVEARGADVIEIKVYVNVTPLLWTEIKVELTATPIAGTTSVGEHMITGAFPIVGAIILAVLIIVGIIVLTWGIVTVVRSFKHQGLSETLKKTMSRETLISMVGDFEKKLHRTPTPPEELDAKTHQQLRTYCDEMANAIAPPGFNWMPWVLGGVGVLAVGGIAAVVLSRKRA